MPDPAFYRHCFDQEKDANAKMLGMLESVPTEKRGEERHQRAVNLAAHLCACRENFLDMLAGDGKKRVPWWEASASLESLRDRYANMERAWTEFLDRLTPLDLAGTFVIDEGEHGRYKIGTEAQLLQLVGHAFYHRGQVALLIDQIGGETVDTDYIEWEIPRHPDWGLVED